MSVTKPFVIWITGLSGAGKSTFARRLKASYTNQGISAMHLDGDEFRDVVGYPPAYDPNARLENAFRLARMCKLLASQGINVVCSTMSLHPEVWEWNRANIPGYFEVYLKVPLAQLKERDPKGLYRRAAEGLEKNVVGWDLPINEPPAPDLVIENLNSSPAEIEARIALIQTRVSAT